MEDGHLNLPPRIHKAHTPKNASQQEEEDIKAYMEWFENNYREQFKTVFNNMGIIGTL